jgi:small subunit ribosomal protein S1
MKGFSEQELYAKAPSAPETTPGKSSPEEKQKKGRVLAIRGGDVFVDVPGGRSQGVLPASQFPQGPPEVGSEVAFHIDGYDAENGLLILALQGAAQTADWSSVAVGMIVEARVTETNKGGLAVDVNGIRGFMPISQIDLYRVEDTQQFVNQRLRSMVVEVKPSERNLVVSRRALLEKEREENREKLWQELAEGQIREGIVRSIRDFGAFVDLGGVDGLLHVSEMSWTRVKDPSTIVKPGQSVKVIVLKIDRERRKVSLGLKQLSASPWDDIGSKYPVGSMVKGKVTRLMDFGAFVELEPGIEGLIHISELAPQRVHRVGDFVQSEQEIQVKVLSVDATQRRISLSLKAALPEKAQTESDAEVVEEESEVEIKRPRRTTPLRGGIGGE